MYYGKRSANQPSSWGIEDKTSGKLIGTIGFMNCSFDHNSAEIGYSLSKEHWNKGLMTEAVEVCLDYAFGEMHLNRVEAQHEVSNPSSGRVMEKCGMKKEGVMRERLYNKGRYVDVCVYAIVRSDWRAWHRRQAGILAGSTIYRPESAEFTC